MHAWCVHVACQMPRRVHRRADVSAAPSASSTRPSRRRRRTRSKSSMTGISANAPARRNISVDMKMAWSPYGNVHSLQRRATAFSTSRMPRPGASRRNRNAPALTPGIASVERTWSAKPVGSAVSAWRKSRTDPHACFAPRFCWNPRLARPARTSAPALLAISNVASILPPSTTITSFTPVPSSLETACPIRSASLRAGMMTEMDSGTDLPARVPCASQRCSRSSRSAMRLTRGVSLVRWYESAARRIASACVG